MQITGSWEPAFPVTEVWDVLNDPTVLARYTPGCQSMESVGPDTFKLDLKVAVAGIGGRYQATMQKVDMQMPVHYGLRVEGQGPIGIIQVTGAFDLAAAGSGTRVNYLWDITIGGPMAGVASRVAGGVAKMMVGQFLKDLERELASRGTPEKEASIDGNDPEAKV